MKTMIGLTYCLVFSAIACQAKTQLARPRETAQVAMAAPRCLAAGQELDSVSVATSPCAPETANSNATENSNTTDAGNAPGEALPDAPLPKPMENNNQYTAPFHLDERNRTWGQAMRNPVVLSSSLMLAGLTSIQLIKTDRCINENKPACNLITGKNRDAAYALNIPLAAGLIWTAARLKQEGKSTGLFFLLTSGLIAEGTLAYTANPHVLVCQAGRTPQCQ